MTNADESFDISSYQSRNREELLRSLGPEIVAYRIGNPRITFDLFHDGWNSGENCLLKHVILLPCGGVLNKWMLRISGSEIFALCRSAQNKRTILFVQQPQGHALRVQKASNRAQHLADQIFRHGRAR